MLGLAVSACGGGPDAPLPGAMVDLCASNFCMSYPDDWEVVEQGEDYVSLRHPAAPDEILATVGQTGMEGLVNAAGREWPQPLDTVVRSFWDLIDEGNAELATLTNLPDGSATSFGAYENGRLWYRIVPIADTAAIGVEVRAPNSTWADHAALITESVVPIG